MLETKKERECIEILTVIYNLIKILNSVKKLRELQNLKIDILYNPKYLYLHYRINILISGTTKSSIVRK